MPVSEVHELLGSRFFGILAVEETAGEAEQLGVERDGDRFAGLVGEAANSGSLSCPLVLGQCRTCEPQSDETSAARHRAMRAFMSDSPLRPALRAARCGPPRRPWSSFWLVTRSACMSSRLAARPARCCCSLLAGHVLTQQHAHDQ